MTRTAAGLIVASAALMLAACSATDAGDEPAPLVTADSGVVLWPQYGDFAIEGNKAVMPAQGLRLDGDAEGADYMTRIAATPQSRWVGNFTWNDSNSDRVLGVLRAAEAQAAIGLLTIAGDPGDECQVEPGSEDAAYDTYLEFIEAVATPLEQYDQPEAGLRVWAIVEPGSVASWGDCDGQGRRGDMLAAGIERLDAAGYTVYVDIGGAGQLEPAEAAARLAERLPVEAIEGFAIGMGALLAVEDQVAYGDAVVDALADLGVDGLGYVIDTSRTGHPIDDPDPCNPPEAAIGKAPRIVDEGSLDAYVWIKRPGESDGVCNGGITEGQFSPAVAMALARNGNPEEAR